MAAEKEASVLFSFVLTLSRIYSQCVVLLLLYGFTEIKLTLPLERQKSELWLCSAEKKKKEAC